MEQGSIPLKRPQVEVARLFPSSASALSPTYIHASRNQVEQAIIRELSLAVGATFTPSTLTEAELALACELEETYALAEGSDLFLAKQK
jgi:hypothetical protein